MATLTKNNDGDLSLGNLRGELLTLQPGTQDYVAGGYLVQGIGGNPLSAGDVGMTKILAVIPMGGQGGLSPVFNPTTSKVVIWAPAVAANTPITAGPVSVTSTLSAMVSGVGTITIANTLKAGNFVLLKSFTQLGALNGQIVKVVTASATQFTFSLGGASNVTSGADVTGTYQRIHAGSQNVVGVGATAAITNSLSTSSLLTMTVSNSFVPGQFVYIDGLTNGATANGVIVQVLTASATQFTANWTGTSFLTGADSGTVAPLVSAGGAPIVTLTATAVTNSLATASSAGTAGVITLTAVNGYAPNNIVVVQNLVNGAAVNGDLLAINAASLTSKVFVANHPTAAFSTGADTGTAALLVTGSPASGAADAAQEVEAGMDLSAYTFQLLAIGL